MQPLTNKITELTSGLFQNKNNLRQEQINNILAESSDLRSDFGGGGLAEIFKIKNPAFEDPEFEATVSKPMLSNKEYMEANKSESKGFDWKNSLAQALRYASPVSNILQSSSLNKPTTPRGSRVEAEFEPKPFDINLLTNQINAAYNPQGAAQETSGGSLSRFSALSQAGNLNKLRALTEGVVQGDQINRTDDRFGFQMGQRKNMMNAQLDERFLERQAQDDAAYQNTKAAFQSQLATDLGSIGKEELQKELMKKMFGYDWRGNFLAAYGGKVKRKK